MFLKEVFLGLVGLSAGGIIAAGVFAFLAMIGIFPRLIGRTQTKNHVMLYESWIILGGILGNIVNLFDFSFGFGGNIVLGIFGISSGIFVGCLVMSLAETLKALPVFSRRIHLAVGLQYVILSIGLGKLIGSLIFFSQNLKK